MSFGSWMRWLSVGVLATACLVPPAEGKVRPAQAQGQGGIYKPTWESVAQHPLPRWFDDAKLGIFIHWGLFSVPAWALPQPPHFSLTEFLTDPGQFQPGGAATHAYGIMPYAEWYYNTMQIEGSATWEHHRQTYPNPNGPIAAYLNFIPTFNQQARSWQPNQWAGLFQDIGARYVVLVTRHHDGFSLWPSAVNNPHRGPDQQHAERDVVGELTTAVRARGLKMGLYYSGGIDWSFPPAPVAPGLNLPQLPIKTILDFVAPTPITQEYADYVDAQYRELIQRYRPSVLWNDIANPKLMNTPALFADYYNTIPDGVVNDRWGPLPSWEMPHADFTTPENEGPPLKIRHDKWEATRALGTSFAYNQNENEGYFLTADELVQTLVDNVSKNGNLLLGVGPAADGSIPPLQLQRLQALGRWMRVNGEAIHGTRPWDRFGFNADVTGVEVRFTQKGRDLYAILFDKPSRNVLVLPEVRPRPGTRIALLGSRAILPWRQVGNSIVITLPPSLQPSEAYTLRLINAL